MDFSLPVRALNHVPSHQLSYTPCNPINLVLPLIQARGALSEIAVSALKSSVPTTATL